MIAFVFVDADGLPLRGGMHRAVPEGAIVLPPPWTTADIPRLRYRNGAWEVRPQPTEPQPGP